MCALLILINIMNVNLLLVFFIALLVSCEKKHPNVSENITIPKEFIGHFVSDRDATIAKWKATQPWGKKTSEVIEKFETVLGTTEIILDGTRCTNISGDVKEEGVVKFLSIDGTTAEVSNYSSVWEREIVSRLEADSKGYWVYSDDPVKGYCERFSRKL